MADLHYLTHVETDGRALIEAARSQPDAAIGACPGWSATDLLDHLGMVYSFVNGIVAALSAEPVAPGPEANRPEGADPGDWLGERLETLLATLHETPADTPVWTWAPQSTAAFFRRRMAHETSVHRWDMATAIGSQHLLDPELSADGIGEYLEVGLIHSTSPQTRAYPTSSLHLHRTDGEGEWMLTTDDDGVPVVTREHGKGDAALRGSAADLLLFVWNRGRDDLELFGDGEVADQWADMAP